MNSELALEMCAGQEPKHAHRIQSHQHGDHRRQARPQGPWRVHQFSRNHAVATSLPTSSAIPIAITGQNAPAKIVVNPSMEKAAETPVSASAADSVANVTGVLRCFTAEAGVTRVTGSVTPAVTPRSAVTAVTDSVTASVTPAVSW
jgi:hypothetical protein